MTPLSDLVNDVSRRMASSQLSRRTSKSSGHNPSRSRSSARIEKPRSIHNSPKRTERRKTMTGVKPYVSLDQHFEAMFGHGAAYQSQDETLSRASRPFSWHPSSVDQPGFGHPSPARTPFTPAIPRRSLTPASDLDARKPMAPFTSGPELQTTFGTAVPSDFQARPSSLSLPYVVPSVLPTNSWVAAHGLPADRNHPISNEAYFAQWDGEPVLFPTQGFPEFTPAQPTLEPSQHPFPDFLPIQKPTSPDAPKSRKLGAYKSPDMTGEELGQELVGLGLYDPPTQHSSRLVARHADGLGKGLKLEEAWKPPEGAKDEEEPEGAEEEYDGVSDEPYVEEEEGPPLFEPGLQLEPRIEPQRNLAGTTFFFDDDDTLKAEWAPALNAGLGYGWDVLEGYLKAL